MKTQILDLHVVALSLLVYAGFHTSCLAMGRMPEDRTSGVAGFDLDTGLLKWMQFPQGISRVAMISGEGALYLIAEKPCTLYRINPSSGHVVWQKPLNLWGKQNSIKWTMHAKPTGMVVRTEKGLRVLLDYGLVGAKETTMHAAIIDGESGDFLTSFVGNMKLAGSKVILCGNSVFRVDPETGTVLVSF